jgi:hypothetical protein
MIIGISGKIGSGKDAIGWIIKDLTFEAFIKSDIQSEWGKLKDWEIKKFAGKLKQIASLLTGVPVEKFEDQEFKKLEMGEEWDYKSMYDLGWDKEWTKQAADYPSRSNMEDTVHKYTYRRFLQVLGTEAMRNQIHSNVWVNALFADYKHVWNDPDPIEGNDYNITYRKDYPNTEESLIHYGGGSEAQVFTKEIEQSNWIITDARFPNEADAVKDRGGIMIRVNRPCPECGVLEGHKMKPHKIPPSTHPSETGLDDYQNFDYVIENDGTIEELIEKVKEILTKEEIIK